jgi:hypothetical protein
LFPVDVLWSNRLDPLVERLTEAIANQNRALAKKIAADLGKRDKRQAG